MRLAGSTLVAAALLLDLGGVEYTPSTPPPSPAELESAETAICKVPVPGGASIDLSGLRARPGLVPLNTQGYNYSASGEYRPAVPSTRGLRPAGVPAVPSSPVPAAPAPAPE
ncbi:MAG: hypothetical protein ACE5IL_15290 [Myxococcota bacterium]